MVLYDVSFIRLYYLPFSLVSVLNGDLRPSEVHNILPVSLLSEGQSAPHVRLRHDDLTTAVR